MKPESVNITPDNHGSIITVKGLIELNMQVMVVILKLLRGRFVENYKHFYEKNII